MKDGAFRMMVHSVARPQFCYMALEYKLCFSYEVQVFMVL